MGIGGVEGVGAAVNVFIGMVESPLIIRPYLMEISRSELFTIMACGMATIAGTVMVIYASILYNVIPGIMGHLLVASIISAPAAITVSKLMIPETSDLSQEDVEIPREASSSMDAITRGTLVGIKLLINIIAMLVVFVALVYLLNMVLAFFAGAFRQTGYLSEISGLRDGSGHLVDRDPLVRDCDRWFTYGDQDRIERILSLSQFGFIAGRRFERKESFDYVSMPCAALPILVPLEL